MGDKVDLKRELDAYRAKRGEYRTLEVPPQQYLMIDGHGDPNTATAYREAIDDIGSALRAHLVRRGVCGEGGDASAIVRVLRLPRPCAGYFVAASCG